MTIRGRANKVVDAAEAVARVRSGSVLAVAGAGGVQEPDLLLSALAQRFRDEGLPRDLTELHPIRTGEREGRGTSLLGEPGLVRRMIGGSFWPRGSPEFVKRILRNEMAAYNLPIGVLYAMLDATGAGRPGVVSKIGLGTFVDPRHGGSGLNDQSRDQLVQLLTIAGEEYLFYRSLPVDVAFIRGSYADVAGNISMEQEAAICGPLLLARAAKASGGRVIAQVKQVVAEGALDPRLIRVPGTLVDDVVAHPAQQQIPDRAFDPTLVGLETFPLDQVPPLRPGPARVVLRRALLQAGPGETVAIGVGLPAHLPALAVEECVWDMITFTTEHGLIGGLNAVAAGGTSFPASHNPAAIIDAADQLQWYAAGGPDRVFLGMGEVDAAGNVNVSRFADRIPGCGGFIELTQGNNKIVFCAVLGDAGRRKVVPQVSHLTFNAGQAVQRGKQVLYVTERAVFELRPGGLTLVETAGGDPRDLLDQLGTDVRVAPELRPMPQACFAAGKIGLRDSWLAASGRAPAIDHIRKAGTLT